MIRTARLLLRRWRVDDAAAHRSIVSHPRVVATLGGPPPAEASAQTIARQNRTADATGSCFWAVEEAASGRMIGWCGVKEGPAGSPIADRLEVGWTLHPSRWGRGYAGEAAAAALSHVWATTAACSIWAVTTPANRASRAVMERLGMRHMPGEGFDHPALEAGDPLRRHVAYRLDRPR